MSNILSRQQWRLIQRGYTPLEARRIAYQQQVKAGNIVPWTYQLTEKWKAYSNLEPRQRAIARYAKHHNTTYDNVVYQDWAKIRKKKIRF